VGKRGYNEDEVDAFLDWVEAALRDPAAGHLTAEQVRNVAFSKPPIGKRGYNEDEVDAFLSSVEQHFGRAAGVVPSRPAREPAGHTVESSPGGPLAATALKITPNPLVFWTPRWHDWRATGNSSDSTSDLGSDNLFVDLIMSFLFDFVFPIFLDFLWNRFLWVIWGAIAWLLEGTVALVLSPIALLTSLLAVPRHRLVSATDEADSEYLWDKGSWYAMRRARAEVRAQLARQGTPS